MSIIQTLKSILKRIRLKCKCNHRVYQIAKYRLVVNLQLGIIIIIIQMKKIIIQMKLQQPAKQLIQIIIILQSIIK